MRRERVLALILTLSLVLVSAAFAQKATSLTYATWWGGANGEAIQAILDSFQTKNPNVSVQLMIWGWEEYPDKIMTSVAGGSAPDIMMVDQTRDFATYCYQDILEPMESYAKAARYDLKKLLPGVQQSFTYSGKFLSLPIYMDQMVVWCNTDLFKQAGIKMLPNVPTWDEVAAAAKAIRALGSDIYGINMAPNYLGYFFEKGLPFADSKGNYIPVNGAKYVQAVQWLVDLYKQCGMPSGLEFDPMTTGKLGISVQVVGTVFGYQPKVTFDSRITNVPITNRAAGQFAYTYSNGISITKGGKNMRAAFDVIAYVVSDEGQTIASKYYTVMPGIDCSIRTKLMAKQSAFPYDGLLIVNAKNSKRAASPPQTGWYRTVSDAVKDQFYSVVSGDITPQQYLDNVNAAYEQWKAAQ